MRLNTFYELDKFTIVSSFLFDGRIIKTKPIGTRPVEELQEWIIMFLFFEKINPWQRGLQKIATPTPEAKDQSC